MFLLYDELTTILVLLESIKFDAAKLKPPRGKERKLRPGVAGIVPQATKKEQNRNQKVPKIVYQLFTAGAILWPGELRVAQSITASSSPVFTALGSRKPHGPSDVKQNADVLYLKLGSVLLQLNFQIAKPCGS